MIPLHAWLDDWDHLPVHGVHGRTIIQAAAELDRRVALHGIDLMVTTDPWAYRRIIERATETFKDTQAVPSILPLLNRHADPISRLIRPSLFFALVGTRPERPAPLLTTATGCRYDGPIRSLLETQRLWTDRTATRAPFKEVCVEGVDKALDALGPVHHCGSTWVDIEHRGKDIGKMMARINVMCAWLKFGAFPIFGTTVPGKNFHAERVIGKASMDGTPSDLIIFSPNYVVADAQSVLTMNQSHE